MQTTDVTVSEIMSSPVVTVGPEARVADILELSRAKHIHHFPIMAAGELLGFTCTCDLGEADEQALVLPLAWHYPATVSPRCAVLNAARLLLLHGVGSLVVFDAAGVHGIVTSEDLRRADPELEALLEDARCMKCGAGEHLRPAPDGQSICIRCKTVAARGSSSTLRSSSTLGSSRV